MPVLLVFGLFTVIAAAHNITHIEVPFFADPLTENTLVCHYRSESNDPPIHSVKWYRGSDEIFRFMPGQTPLTRTFNSSDGAITQHSCNLNSCAISVTIPPAYHQKFAFTCEVSTEGPRFEVVKATRDLVVAIALKEDPEILGVPGTVQLEEDVMLNCTAKPAMPPANIMWYIDGRPEQTEWKVNNTQYSSADVNGLRSSWRPLRLRVSTTKGFMALRCDAEQPTWPPYVRSTNSTLVIARTPHLSMFTAAGSSSSSLSIAGLILAPCITVHIFFKYSALTQV